jgi:hypothetical protein
VHEEDSAALCLPAAQLVHDKMPAVSAPHVNHSMSLYHGPPTHPLIITYRQLAWAPTESQVIAFWPVPVAAVLHADPATDGGPDTCHSTVKTPLAEEYPSIMKYTF